MRKGQQRQAPTALQRYEAERIHGADSGRRFPQFADYEDRFREELSDDDRNHLIAIFAKQRNETPAETVAMIGSHIAETGLTFDELLWHHWCSGWDGGMTIGERQRRAAYKAWDTIRANRKQAQIDEEIREAEING